MADGYSDLWGRYTKAKFEWSNPSYPQDTGLGEDIWNNRFPRVVRWIAAKRTFTRAGEGRNKSIEVHYHVGMPETPIAERGISREI